MGGGAEARVEEGEDQGMEPVRGGGAGALIQEEALRVRTISQESEGRRVAFYLII